MAEKIKCSVEILTFNSGKTLRKALESVKDFDEIIIIDGGSEDNTLEIAKEFNCLIIEQDRRFKYDDNRIKDFSGVRNQGLDIAKNDWFLFLDSDEYLSEELVEEIKKIVDNKVISYGAYWLPRKYVINGEVIDYATTYPNVQMRLFNKRFVSKFYREVHEKIRLKEKVSVGKLNNYELVPMTDSFSDIVKKWNYYLSIGNRREISVYNSLHGAFVAIKSSILYVYRLIKIWILPKKGKKMPLKLELLRHWYNLKIVFISIKDIYLCLKKKK